MLTKSNFFLSIKTQSVEMNIIISDFSLRYGDFSGRTAGVVAIIYAALSLTVTPPKRNVVVFPQLARTCRIYFLL